MLQYRPDLMFIELAVNDGDAGELILRSVEGIIRHAMEDNPPSLCLKTLNKLTCEYEQGQLPRTVRLHEQAEHYGVRPSTWRCP